MCASPEERNQGLFDLSEIALEGLLCFWTFLCILTQFSFAKYAKLFIGLTEMQQDWYKRVLRKDAHELNALGGPSQARLMNVLMHLRKVSDSFRDTVLSEITSTRHLTLLSLQPLRCATTPIYLMEPSKDPHSVTDPTSGKIRAKCNSSINSSQNSNPTDLAFLSFVK